MGYNDVIVCHGDKSDERVLFHRTGSITSDKSRSIAFLIMHSTALRSVFLPKLLTASLSQFTLPKENLYG